MESQFLTENLANKVADLIRHAILTGELKAGEKIPQDDLAEAYGVSRMPIREALVILNYEGLVNLEPRRGAWVAPMTLQTVDESYAIRHWAESQAVYLSVPRLSSPDLAEAQRALETLEGAENRGDTETFIRANAEFHTILRRRCPWPKLTTLVESLWKGFPPLSPQFVTGQMARDHDEHRRLLASAQEGQADEAKQLMEHHIQRSWNMARTHFQDLGWSESPPEKGMDTDALH